MTRISLVAAVVCWLAARDARLVPIPQSDVFVKRSLSLNLELGYLFESLFAISQFLALPFLLFALHPLRCRPALV
jgi:hypothetical protein